MDKRLYEVATERHELHRDHPTSRPLSKDYEYVGLAGESAFAQATGLPPDLTLRAGGDKGQDFLLPLGFSVDVKTARKAGHLILEVGKPVADIYVLAEYSDETGKATLVGWTWGRLLAKAPSRDFGYGVINHYIPRAELRPMSELLKRMAVIVSGAA